MNSQHANTNSKIYFASKTGFKRCFEKFLIYKNLERFGMAKINNTCLLLKNCVCVMEFTKVIL